MLVFFTVAKRVFQRINAELASLDDRHKILGRLKYAVVLVFVSLIAAAIYYGLERQAGIDIEFSTCVYYVNTVHTSIGYGNVTPHSRWSKLFTCVYALLAIPLVLAVLENLGEIFFGLSTAAWIWFINCIQIIKKFLRLRLKSNRIRPLDPEAPEKTKVYTPAAVPNCPPLGLGISITVLWIIIGGAMFAWMEPDWEFGDSLYFMFISMSTVGFGDFALYNSNLVFYQFAVLFIGLALFSMCLNIVQQNITDLTQSVIQNIVKQYQEQLVDGEQTLETDAGKVGDKINDILSQQGSRGSKVLRLFIGQAAHSQLVDEYCNLANKRTLGTQTDVTFGDTRSSACQATAVQLSVGCQANLQRSIIDNNGRHLSSVTMLMSLIPPKMQ